MGRAFRIANWKLAMLALGFFCLFSGLGIWQLVRAEQKSALVKAFAARTEQMPLSAKDLMLFRSRYRFRYRSRLFLEREEKPGTVTETVTGTKKQVYDLRFYRLQLTGKFDTEHTFLLDNKTFHGQIGYEVYTPFKAEGLETIILIDRGFIPLSTNRAVLPTLQTPTHTVTITGLLNLPPTYVALGEMRESPQLSWPLRIEYIHLDKMSALLSAPLFSYILTLTPNDPAAYQIKWQPVIMGPERHRGYALQWFALAITLLILFVALNRGDKQP